MARTERSFQINIRVEGELLDRLMRASASEHRSMSNYVKHVLMEWLNGQHVDEAEAAEERLMTGFASATFQQMADDRS